MHLKVTLPLGHIPSILQNSHRYVIALVDKWAQDSAYIFQKQKCIAQAASKEKHH